MKNLGKFALIILAFLFLLNSETHAEQTAAGSEDMHMTIEKSLKLPPLTATDVIENIKAISGSDFFFSAAFNDKESLIKFCNGKSIETLGKDEDYLIIRGIDIKGINGSSIDFLRRERNGRPAAGIKISFYSPLITVDYLTSVFGQIEKLVDPYKNQNPRHPVPVKPKTHRYGNMEVHHVIKGESAITEIIYFVTGDGSISGFTAVQTRR